MRPIRFLVPALCAAGLGVAALAQAPVRRPKTPISGEIFHAQVLLDAAGFPSGVIDGKKGMVFGKALSGFQEANGLEVTGVLDTPTRRALLAQNRPATIMVTLTPEQVAGPFVPNLPKKPEDQAELPFLGYRNMLEAVAEEFHTTPATIVAINPPNAMIGAGQTLRLPNVVPANRDYKGAKPDIAPWFARLNVDGGSIQGDYIVVSKREGVLKVMRGAPPAGPLSKDLGKNAVYSPPEDVGSGQVVAQFPVTMGSTHDPLPYGLWKAVTYAFLPPFHYQPNLFWDAKDKSGDDKMLKPGPNNPVGLAWLDLTKEHYGIHGTPTPETIGRAESHGCIRLSNWDVLRLARMLKPGFKAVFTD